MPKKSEEMTVREYMSMRRGVLLTMRAQPTNALWVLVSQLKYHSKYPHDMIDEVEKTVRGEREKTTNQGEAATQ